MPDVDLRTLDPRGGVWAIAGRYLLDETRAAASALPEELPCPTGPTFALAFETDGRAFAIAAGRFYVRAGRDDPFRVTPLCTNVGGAPFAASRDGGFLLVSTPPRGRERSLLITRDRTGAMGWFAVTGLDPTITEAVLEGDRSMAILSAGGHLVAVDQSRVVAGEVLATQGERFTGIRRTAAGLVAWRDDTPTQRVLVMADTVGGDFTRVAASHPAARTLAVFRLDLARVVALTDRGVELSTDNGEHFARVFDRPVPEAFASRSGAGWLPGRHPALALPDGIATDDCTAVNVGDAGTPLR